MLVFPLVLALAAPGSQPEAAAEPETSGVEVEAWLRKRRRLRILGGCFGGTALLGAAGIITGVALDRGGSDPHGSATAVGVGVGAPVLAVGLVGLIATGVSASLHQSKRPEGIALLGGKARVGFGTATLLVRF